MERKSVLIIYCGGTMGMRPDASGSLCPVPGYLTACINELPEMSRPEMPKFDIIEYQPLLDSSCMGPEEWIKIAEDIEKAYLNYVSTYVRYRTQKFVNLFSLTIIGWLRCHNGDRQVYTCNYTAFSHLTSSLPLGCRYDGLCLQCAVLHA